MPCAVAAACGQRTSRSEGWILPPHRATPGGLAERRPPQNRYARRRIASEPPLVAGIDRGLVRLVRLRVTASHYSLHGPVFTLQVSRNRRPVQHPRRALAQHSSRTAWNDAVGLNSGVRRTGIEDGGWTTIQRTALTDRVLRGTRWGGDARSRPRVTTLGPIQRGTIGSL